MKNKKAKPMRHKEGNTFQYKPFSARVAEISVGSAGHFSRRNLLEPSENESYFFEAFTKWQDLNRTGHFVDFQKEVYGKIQTHALVVRNKDLLIAVLKRHLSIKDNLATQPLLDLLVNLARDLPSKDDLYPHFGDFFQIFKDQLITSNDPEILESTFSCLAELFVILRKPMHADYMKIFHLISPLFDEHQRDYVIRFATESFAFILRSYRDTRAIVGFLLDEVVSNSHLAGGMGKLFFECIKNVNHSLHVARDKFLPAFFSVIQEERFADGLLDDVITEFMDHLRSHVTAASAKDFWELFWAFKELFMKSPRYFFKILSLWSQHKGGVLLNGHQALIPLLTDEFAINGLCINGVADFALPVFRDLLMLDYYNLEIQTKRKLVRMVLHSNLNLSRKIEFAEGLLSMPLFEVLVLPQLFAAMLSEEVQNQDMVLVCLSKLALEKNGLLEVDQVLKSKTKAFDLSLLDPAVAEVVQKNIAALFERVFDDKESSGNEFWARQWAFVLLMPYFRTVIAAKQEMMLRTVMSNCISELSSTSAAPENSVIIGMAFYCSLVAMHWLQVDFSAFVTYDKILAVLRHNKGEPGVLAAAELYFRTRADMGNQIDGGEYLAVLRWNLRHPSRAVRVSTLRIWKCIGAEQEKKFAQICLDAEMVDATLHEYREKLRFLRELELGQMENRGFKDDILQSALLYLFGCLKEGFLLVRKEIKELIMSYQSRMVSGSFWPVVTSEFETASMEAETERSESLEAPHAGHQLSELCQASHDSFADQPVKPLNAHKYRVELWQTFKDMAHTVEPKNRLFVGLFLQFIRKEFSHVGGGLIENSTSEDDEPSVITKRSVRETEETLIVMLEFLSKMRNPSVLAQEPLLRDLMMELLLYRNGKVQELALKYFLNYGWSYLEPYQEHVMKLVNEKEIRGALLDLDYGSSTSVVAPEHRKLFSPFMLRLLCGRIQSKTTRAGKGSPTDRKGAVVRILSNCNPEELKYFMEIVLKPVNKLLAVYPLNALTKENVSEKINVNAKVVDGVMHTLLIVARQLQATAEPIFHDMLHLVLVALRFARSPSSPANEQPETTRTHSHGAISRRIRKDCFDVLSVLSESFPFTTYSEEEVDALKQTVIVPELEGVKEYAATSPPHLVRLALIWSKKMSYFPLFGTVDPASEHTLIELIVSVLEPELNAKPKAVKMVLDIVHNLLLPPVDENDDIEAAEAAGRKIVSQILGPILSHMKGKLREHLAQTKTASSPLTESEMDIVEILGQLNLSAEQSADLFGLLVSVLVQTQWKKEASLLRFFSMVEKQCQGRPAEELQPHMKQIISLLSSPLGREPRTSIGQIIQEIGNRVGSGNYMDIAQDVAQLLAWDPKHLEEPDYEARIGVYKRARTLVARWRTTFVSTDHLLLLVHVALHDISTVGDINAGALRTMASLVLTDVIEAFCPTDLRDTLLSVLTPAVKAGLKSREEIARNEFITILSCLVRCNSSHAFYGPLSVLLSPDDPERDVFENLRHIQKHRVARAFGQIAQLCSAEKLPVSSLTQLFLPMASGYLCNEEYSSDKSQALITAVVNLIGPIAGKLPWAKYEAMLKHFLTLLTRKPLFQKQIIRVVVAIVDNFHFVLPNIREKADSLPDQMDTDPSEEPIETPQDGKDSVPAAKGERILRSLNSFILPTLYDIMSEKPSGDDFHKKNAKLDQDEKRDVFRAPIAFVIVRLLQKLPQRILRREIHGVFLRIARLLQSRLASVRKAARETLSEIMMAVGPSYLGTLIKALRGILTRGYQVHVMVHCVHMVLSKLMPILKNGDLDNALDDLVQLCHEELFGQLSEEKRESKVTRVIAESGGERMKSYETYSILARFASPRMLVTLIAPLKQKAEETRSSGVAEKLEKALRQIHSGLVNNTTLSERDLMLFAHALCTSNSAVFATAVDAKESKQSTNAVENNLKPDDCYIIPKEPNMRGTASSSNRNSCDYLIKSIGLQILLSCLKNNRLKSDQPEHLAMLDPFVEIIKDSLKRSDHIDVMTNALKCLTWMFKFRLPSFELNMDALSKSLFIKLKNTSGPGSAIGENARLVTAIYKALSAFVRDYSASQLTPDNLKALVVYIQEDVHEDSKQVLAFTLLKAILSRHFLSEELKSLMLDLAKRSIQSESYSFRTQCQQLVVQYLATYHADKIDLKSFVELYRDNLEYGIEYGRLICLQTLGELQTRLGKGFVLKHGLNLFHLYATRLSDESATCRAKAAASMLELFNKLDDATMKQVVKWVQRWMSDQEIPVKAVGYQACTLLVKHEKSAFKDRLLAISPLVLRELKADRTSFDEDTVRQYDSLLVNVLTLFRTIEEVLANILPELSEPESKKVARVFDAVKPLMLHENEWVRIKALDVTLALLQACPPESLSTSFVFLPDPVKKITSLAILLLHQFKSYSDREEYYSYWADCSMIILKTVCLDPAFGKSSQSNGHDVDAVQEDDIGEDDEPKDDEPKETTDTEQNNADKTMSFQFFISGVCREAVFEALHEPKRTAKRLQVMRWIQRVFTTFNRETCSIVLPNCVGIIYRCLNEPSALKDETLKKTTEEVGSLVESKVGREEYADAMKLAIGKASTKRAQRKRLLAAEPVTNPEKAARKRIKKQQTKKETRKRKIAEVELGLRGKFKRSKAITEF